VNTTLGGLPPSLLGASMSQDNALFTAHLTNRPLEPLGGHSTPQGVLHVGSTRLLWNARLYERISLTNYGDLPAMVPLELSFTADFRDMFEVRGATRLNPGIMLEPKIAARSVMLSYRGLDGNLRSSAINFSAAPAKLGPDRAVFLTALPQHGRADIYIEVGTAPAEAPSKDRFRTAAAHLRFGIRANRRRGATIRTSGRLFNEWTSRGPTLHC
jgi:glycogen debranching enzyme